MATVIQLIKALTLILNAKKILIFHKNIQINTIFLYLIIKNRHNNL